MVVSGLNRREYLKTMLGAPLVFFTPSINSKEFDGRARRTLLIELAGANDSLNTVIPFRQDNYYRLRPKIALNKTNMIGFNGDYAVNSVLMPILDLWENGEMAVVPGLGYPKPNRSHFKSKDIWETGGDGRDNPDYGWITHDIEHKFAQTDSLDSHGISLGGGTGIFRSQDGIWISAETISNLSSIRDDSTFKKDQTTDTLNQVSGQFDQLYGNLKQIGNKLENSSIKAERRKFSLEQQARNFISIIREEVNTPIFKLSQSGYDTHQRQLYRQTKLLSELAVAIRYIRDELVKMGEWNNTLLVTYSEFGRRVEENGSGGTDHGTAATHFIMGGQVNGGFYGTHPSLEKLDRGDLIYNLDYRSVYDQVLSNWYNIEKNKFTGFNNSVLNNLIKA